MFWKYIKKKQVIILKYLFIFKYVINQIILKYNVVQLPFCTMSYSKVLCFYSFNSLASSAFTSVTSFHTYN